MASSTHHGSLEVQGVVEHGACLPVLDFHEPGAFGRAPIVSVLGRGLAPGWRRLENREYKVRTLQQNTGKGPNNTGSCIGGYPINSGGDKVCYPNIWHYLGFYNGEANSQRN